MSEYVDAGAEMNQVVLRGRVTGPPTGRELPSGSSIVTFRVSIGREKTHMTAGSKQSSDWVDCVAWAPRLKKSVSSWRIGDTVEVGGALRRRFIRVEGGPATSRLEVEVLKAAVVSRAL